MTDNKSDIDSKVFTLVTGSMRSGTTLLGEILYSRADTRNAHPNVAFSNDNSSTLRKISKYLRQFHMNDADELSFGLTLDINAIELDRASLCNELRTPYDTSLNESSNAFFIKTLLVDDINTFSPITLESTVIGLKQTNITWEISLLSQCFNNTKIIISLRDPRDILASTIKRAETSLPLKEIEFSIFASLAYFDFAATCKLDNVLFVRYEDVVNNCSKEIKRILAFLGLPNDIYNWETIESDSMASNSSYNCLQGKGFVKDTGIHSGSIGKYKDRLTREQTSMVEWLFQPYMEMFKYDYQFSTGAHLTRNMVEKILSLFSSYSSKYRYSDGALYRRLLMSNTDAELKEIRDELGNVAVVDRLSALKDRNKALQERSEAMLKRNKALQERAEVLLNKNKALQGRNEAMFSRNKILQDKNEVLQCKVVALSK